MSRVLHLFLILSAFTVSGCCRDSFFGVIHAPGAWTYDASQRDQFRIDVSFIPDAKITLEPTPRVWDLGRVAAAKGDDRLIVVTRTTSYPDRDEDGDEIVGTLRDRKVERVWLTIPAGTPWGQYLKIEDLETQNLTGYEVDNLDGKGYFRGPHLMKGYLTAIEEQCGMMVVIFDIEVRPNRPFQAENWKLEGKHTLRRNETIQWSQWRDVDVLPASK